MPTDRVYWLLAGGALLLAAGCTWVELTNEGRGVRLANPTELRGCEKIGATHATTTDHVWLFARGEDKIAEELAALARNEAATMGGDAVAARGPASDGRQTFDVYRCGGS